MPGVVNGVHKAQQPAVSRPDQAASYTLTRRCPFKVRSESVEVAVVQSDVFVGPPLPKSVPSDHTPVGAARRIGDAVLTEVERGTPVETDAQQEYARSQLVQPGKRRVLAEVAVRMMVVGDPRGSRAQCGKGCLWMAAAHGARVASNRLGQNPHARRGGRLGVEGRHGVPKRSALSVAQTANPFPVDRGGVRIVRSERGNDQGSPCAQNATECPQYGGGATRDPSEGAQRCVDQQDVAFFDTEFGEPVSDLGLGEPFRGGDSAHGSPFPPPRGKVGECGR